MLDKNKLNKVKLILHYEHGGSTNDDLILHSIWQKMVADGLEKRSFEEWKEAWDEEQKKKELPKNYGDSNVAQFAYGKANAGYPENLVNTPAMEVALLQQLKVEKEQAKEAIDPNSCGFQKSNYYPTADNPAGNPSLPAPIIVDTPETLEFKKKYEEDARLRASEYIENFQRQEGKPGAYTDFDAYKKDMELDRLKIAVNDETRLLDTDAIEKEEYERQLKEIQDKNPYNYGYDKEKFAQDMSLVLLLGILQNTLSNVLQEISKLKTEGVPPGDDDGDKKKKPGFSHQMFGKLTANDWKLVGAMADGVRQALFAGQAANDSSTTSGINLAYDSISTSLMAFAPVGTIVGGAMKAGAFIGDLAQSMGGGTDQMTKTDLILDSSLFSWNVGLINGFGGSKADKFAIDQDTTEKVGSSYGGSMNTLNDALNKSGKKYGLFSSGARKRANALIGEAKRLQGIMSSIAEEATDRKMMATANSDINHLSYGFNLAGGYDLKYNRAARKGMKIVRKEPIFKMEIPKPTIIDSKKEGGTLEKFEVKPFIVELKSPYIDTLGKCIVEFKSGGKTDKLPEIIKSGTEQMSIIPEGAYHKNKHHMDGADKWTKKGIPVVDVTGELQAEIELNEIIFTLEVTKQLEERYKEYYKQETTKSKKDELALEAGKLLWHEILYHTDDRTGLINTLKQGGTIEAPKLKLGGLILQSDIDLMVKQALINILTK